tara:strand:+ start:75 stop:737 length:663 start_codon:yes stop_codon:yes gene_type:complete
MGTTIPNTFSTGDNVDAGKLEANNNAIQEWLNGELLQTDITPDNLQREHFVAPQYTNTNNTFEFITGVYGGKTYSTSQARLTGLCAEPTFKQVDASAPTYQWVANGGISFYLEDRASVLFTISASPISTTTRSQEVGKSRFFVTVDDSIKTETRFVTQSENPSPSRERNFLSTFFATDTLAAGYHHIGIKGFTSSDYVLFTAWTITVEAYYENDNQPEGD